MGVGQKFNQLGRRGQESNQGDGEAKRQSECWEEIWATKVGKDTPERRLIMSWQLAEFSSLVYIPCRL